MADSLVARTVGVRFSGNFTTDGAVIDRTTASIVQHLQNELISQIRVRCIAAIFICFSCAPMPQMPFSASMIDKLVDFGCWKSAVPFDRHFEAKERPSSK